MNLIFVGSLPSRNSIKECQQIENMHKSLSTSKYHHQHLMFTKKKTPISERKDIEGFVTCYYNRSDRLLWPSELMVALTTSTCWSACRMASPEWYAVNTLGIVIYTSPIHFALTFSAISVALFIIDNISPSHRNGFWFIITAPIAPARWIYLVISLKCNYIEDLWNESTVLNRCIANS